MPGYRLMEERMLQPFCQDGIEPHLIRLGFLDYVRELRQETFAFPRGHKIRVVGLDDVLLAAGERLKEVEGYIHGLLTARANELDSAMATHVQIVFRSPLRLSNDFWLEAGLSRHLSLRRIFGRPVRQQGPNGTEFYFVGFNLT